MKIKKVIEEINANVVVKRINKNMRRGIACG